MMLLKKRNENYSEAILENWLTDIKNELPQQSSPQSKYGLIWRILIAALSVGSKKPQKGIHQTTW